ncbi:MAG: HAD-IA family hydrolase [Methylococcales bacterium]|jgi:phosphoglycolate phosphatase|nr:HAD-IA family hydrolase [Methylococcales bacterium]MBT7444156.1 HAD-IA family hydrolase [Methylococcales bacterium]
MRQYDLIVFDWDGTLMDSADDIVYCIQQAALDMELQPVADDQARQIIGLGLKEAVEKLFPGRDDTFVAQLADRYRFHYHESDIQSGLFPHAENVLSTLQSQQYKLAVATGKSRRGLDDVLEQTALQTFFHTTRCADESGSKPDPAMLYHILQSLEVDASRALMVGDTEYDLEMASSAGVASIGVSFGVHDVMQLKRHNPLAIIDRLDHLLTLL